jgi:hypothetical protein
MSWYDEEKIREQGEEAARRGYGQWHNPYDPFATCNPLESKYDMWQEGHRREERRQEDAAYEERREQERREQEAIARREGEAEEDYERMIYEAQEGE